MKKIILSLLIGIALVFVTSSSVYALDPIPLPGLQNLIKWMCETRPAKVQKIREKLEDKNNNLEKKIDALGDALQTTVSYLDKKGYSVGQLEEDLIKFNNKFTEFKSLYEKTDNCLVEAKDYSCNKSAQYKDKIVECRGYWKSTREKAQEIKNFYKTEIRDDLKAMKNQNPE